MKKILSVLMSLILVFSLATFSYAAETNEVTKASTESPAAILQTSSVIASGQYTGNGSTYTIDTGFAPKLIIIQVDYLSASDVPDGYPQAAFSVDPAHGTSTEFVWRSGNNNLTMGFAIEFQTSGFRVKPNLSRSGVVYNWVAIG